MTYEEVATNLKKIGDWTLSSDGKSISRRFRFKNFGETMDFVNAIAEIARQQDHHPDFTTGYNYCVVNYTTHAIDGLSENDFICAAKINAGAPSM